MRRLVQACCLVILIASCADSKSHETPRYTVEDPNFGLLPNASNQIPKFDNRQVGRVTDISLPDSQQQYRAKHKKGKAKIVSPEKRKSKIVSSEIRKPNGILGILYHKTNVGTYEDSSVSENTRRKRVLVSAESESHGFEGGRRKNTNTLQQISPNINAPANAITKQLETSGKAAGTSSGSPETLSLNEERSEDRRGKQPKHGFLGNKTKVKPEEPLILDDKIDDSIPDDDRSEKFLCLPCKCSKFRQLTTTSCSGENLAAVNLSLPRDIWSLDMSNNRVKILSTSDVSFYKYLNSLNFANNKIRTVNFENSTSYSHLSSLDLTRNSFKIVPEGLCQGFPKLTTLIISNNMIAHITPNAFKWCKNLRLLDLSYNKINRIDVSAFDSLGKLLELSLSYNKELGYNSSFFTPRLFHGVGGLKKLFIQGSSNGALKFPNEAIGSIPALTTLGIEGISHGARFESPLANLTNFTTLSFTCNNQTHLTTFNSSFFENTPYIKSLSFHSCKLFFPKLDPTFFAHLRDLESYTVANGTYKLRQSFPYLEGLNYTKVRHLALTGARSLGMPCQSLSVKEMRYIKHLNLTTLDLSNNSIALLFNSFFRYMPKTVEVLILRQNKFTVLANIWKFSSFLPSLLLLDLSLQNVEAAPFAVVGTNRDHLLDVHWSTEDQLIDSGQCLDNDTAVEAWGQSVSDCGSCQTSCAGEDETPAEFLSENIAENNFQEDHDDWEPIQQSAMNMRTSSFPRKLRTLKASGYLYYGSIIHNISTDSLFEIDFSLNLLTDWGYAVLPPSVKRANLSANYCDKIRHTFFPHNSSLEELYIQGNSLGPVLTLYHRGQVFSNAKKLRILNMAANGIYHLPKLFLIGLGSIEELLLEDNKLVTIDLDFNFTPKLRFLDLSKNSLTWISRRSRESLDAIAARHELKIDLTYNPLQCTCEGVEILEWIVRTNVKFHDRDFLTCSSQSRRQKYFIGDINSKINELRKKCASRYHITVSVITFVVFLLFLGIAVLYKNRWKLIYARNVWLVKMFGFRPPAKTARSGRLYDAYVVYCSQDSDFALDVLLQELEEKRGHRLCVEDRDFIPGSFNFSNITCAVMNSTLTLLVVSPGFLEDRTLEYATQMALMEQYNGQDQREVILMLNYKRVKGRQLSKDLLLLMKKGRFLDYPLLDVDNEEEESDEQGDGVTGDTMEAFWDRLSSHIGYTSNKNRATLLNSESY